MSWDTKNGHALRWSNRKKAKGWTQLNMRFRLSLKSGVRSKDHNCRWLSGFSGSLSQPSLFLPRWDCTEWEPWRSKSLFSGVDPLTTNVCYFSTCQDYAGPQENSSVASSGSEELFRAGTATLCKVRGRGNAHFCPQTHSLCAIKIIHWAPETMLTSTHFHQQAEIDGVVGTCCRPRPV